MADEPKKEKKKAEKVPDITFYHPDLFEVPADGSPPYLKGYKCKKCGNVDFPKLDLCQYCWGTEYEMVPLSRRGKLYSFSDIYVATPDLPIPFTIGYVDLPEHIRVFAQLEGPVESFKCEDELELVAGVIGTNMDGLPITSYRFKKVNK
ncbi:MAG: Zn-ribbon domain-containing OB-fold protein [Syntrophobacteraceae bacterium]